MYAEIISIEIGQSETTERKHNQFMRLALRKAAEHQLRVTLGDHYKDNSKTRPGGEYGYVARGKKYTEYKLRRFGHKRPNELTGRSKRYARSNSIIRATKDKSSLRIRFPFPMNAQRKKEMTAITQQEMREKQSIAVAEYKKELAKPGNKRKRKRKVK